MTSLAKIAANRSNSQKSTGPKTANGKSRSRFNAVKSGIYSVHRPLPGEDEKAYQRLSLRLKKRYQPSGPVEELLVDQILGHVWRIQRLERAEKAYLNAIDRTLQIRKSRFDIALNALFSREEDITQGTSKTQLMASARFALQDDNCPDAETDDLGDTFLEASVPKNETQPLVGLKRQRSALLAEVLQLEERLETQRKASFNHFLAESHPARKIRRSKLTRYPRV